MYNYIVVRVIICSVKNVKQVVLSLSEAGNARLRRLASETNSGKKGALSQTAEEAFELLETARISSGV